MAANRSDVIGYPLGGEGRERPLVACWILVMVAFRVPLFAPVPVTVLFGYLLRELGASARGDPAPPFLTDPRSLVWRGASALAVTVSYLAIPTAGLLVTVYGATAGIGEDGVSTAESLFLYGGSTAVLGLFVAAAYLVPAALVGYANGGSIGRAFDVETIVSLAKHTAYLARWMAGAVALGMTTSLASVVFQGHRVGPVVAALVTAYGLLLAVHVWGLGVRRVRERQ